MKFFKLELINRENNYNKMFNAAPNIGTLNLLENKVRMVWKVATKAAINREKYFEAELRLRGIFLYN